MKFLILLAVLLCVSSAYIIRPFDVPIHSKDLAQNLKFEARITNGHNATEGQFPYQVGLDFSTAEGGEWLCGGSLIGKTWILTAAHCTYGASSVKISLGSITRLHPRLIRSVSSDKFIQHNDFNPSTYSNDLSLIKMDAVDENEYIRIIRLPKISSSYLTYSGQQAVASGWGRISDSVFEIVSDLQFANMEVMNNTACSDIFGSQIITSQNLCTSTPNGISTCKGDSGGPLVEVSSKELIGVASFVSLFGCQIGLPDGFVRVTSYLDWIKTHTGISY